MKNKIVKIIVLAFSLNALFTLKAYSQQESDACLKKLVAANKEYEAGHFTECIELLNPCINNLSSNEVFEAHRLMALAYLNLKDDKNANTAAINLLKSKPNYRDFPYFDPVEFTRLLAKYEVWPKWEIGIKAGININSVNPSENYSITGSDATFEPTLGYQFGLSTEYFLAKNISLNTDILYEGISYKRVAKDVSGWNQTFTENLNYFNLPVTAKYYVASWKEIQFCAELGFQMQLLNSTYSNIKLNNNLTNETLEFSDEQQDQRNSLLFYALAGVGAKYKIGGGKLCFNARYAYGLNNINNGDKRYENLDFIIATQYVDSDISFNTLYLSLGYQFPLSKFYTAKIKK